MTKPTMIMLCGPSYTGKSTWARKWNEGLPVASSDKYIEFMANHDDKKYHEVFTDYIDKATSCYELEIVEYIENNVSFIIDRTNLTRKGSKRILDKLPDGYHKEAVIFGNELSVQDWMNRIEFRTDKQISFTVLQQQWKSYQYPSTDEGFDKIYFGEL